MENSDETAPTRKASTVQRTLFSLPGFEHLRRRAERAPAAAFRCDKPGCAKFGHVFQRHCEYTNHLNSKEHTHARVNSRPASQVLPEVDPRKKARSQYSLAYKGRIIDAFEALLEEGGSPDGVNGVIAHRFGIQKQRVSDWWKAKTAILESLAGLLSRPDERFDGSHRLRMGADTIPASRAHPLHTKVQHSHK
eukprot:GHVU01104020.1.p1 GENE.GHVU01104020.1~~GHVU01104020.1.p1  ORF type:complete len:193 (+),score=8.19 GHVU01104020.1:311-889(+)